MMLLQNPWLWATLVLVLLAINYYLSAYVLGAVIAACIGLGLALSGVPGWFCALGFVLTLVLLTPLHGLWLRRQRPTRTVPLIQDQLPGNELIDHALVLKHDLPYGTGRVQIGERLWKVRGEGNLRAGAEVRVTDVDGDTLLIQEKRLHDSGVMSD